MSLESFVQGFCECALWLGKHYANEQEIEDGGGANLDDEFSVSDIPESVMKEIRSDCEGFYDNHAELWGDEVDDSQAGHDFFLTRNRHGTGFWDRGVDNGDELTKAAHVYGSFSLEKHGDEEIHCYNG
jgi:hypothetical protein